MEKITVLRPAEGMSPFQIAAERIAVEDQEKIEKDIGKWWEEGLQPLSDRELYNYLTPD